MAVTSETLERELANDLQVLGDMAQDESFYSELYRALAGVSWHRGGAHVSLSWKRAEELVNAARARQDREPLDLAQTGGEGEVSERVKDALATTGWSPKPLDTGTHDDAHAEARPEAKRGASEAPEWERQAHAEAEENRY
jgi:hypothetical protein